MSHSLIFSFFVALLVTVVVECFLIWMMFRSKPLTLFVLYLNLLTNPLANFINFTIYQFLYQRNLQDSKLLFLFQLILEILIWLTEACLLWCYFNVHPISGRNERKTIFHCLMYSFFLNLCTYSISFLL